jgi:HSP90 family molecular chaperone
LGAWLTRHADDEKWNLELLLAECKPVTRLWKKVHGGKVEKVVVKSRLADSPRFRATSEYDWPANVEHM